MSNLGDTINAVTEPQIEKNIEFLNEVSNHLLSSDVVLTNFVHWCIGLHDRYEECGMTEEGLASLDYQAYFTYFEDGLTPEQAIKEDESYA